MSGGWLTDQCEPTAARMVTPGGAKVCRVRYKTGNGAFERLELAALAAEWRAAEAAARQARAALDAGVREAVAAGVPKSHIAELIGVSRPTIDRILDV